MELVDVDPEEKHHVLHSDTLARTLGESDHVLFEAFSLGGVEPALGLEAVRVGEDGLVVVH